MPYKIVKKSSKYQIVKKDTGKVVGTSSTKKRAGISISYRMKGEKKKKKKGRT